MPKSNKNFFSNPNAPFDNTNIDNQNEAKKTVYVSKFSNNSSPGNYLPGSGNTYSINIKCDTITKTTTIPLRGYQGAQGFQGDIGSTGSQGFQGNAGLIGSIGSQGSQGAPVGFQGSQGLQGNKGNTGSIQGRPGSSFTNVPSASIVNNSVDIDANGIYVVGRYVYTTGQSSFNITDVTNPLLPSIVGTASTNNGFSGGLYVSGKYAYVTNSDSSPYNDINIIDISIPSNPIIIATYSLGFVSPCIYVSGNYAYIPVNNGTYSIVIMDVSDPTSPFIIGTSNINNEARCLYVSGKYAYVPIESIFPNPQSVMNIIDISIPSNPIIVGTASNIGTDVTGIYVSGRYAYLIDNSSNNMNIVDISNPTAPLVVSTLNTPNVSPNFIFVSGNYAYVSYEQGLGTGSPNLKIIDISNPTAPSIIQTIFISGPLYVSGNYLYLTSSQNGLLYIVQLDVNKIGTSRIGSLNVGNQKIYNDLNVGGELTSNSITTYESALIGSDISIQRDINLGRYIIDLNNATGPSGSILTATENGAIWATNSGGNGSQGSQGLFGPTGSQGSQGTQGFQGINGSLGLTANNGVIFGSSSNILQLGSGFIQNTSISLQGFSLTIGNNNLFSIDNSNNTVKMKSSAGTNSTVVSLIPNQVSLIYNNNIGGSMSITMGEDFGIGGMIINDSLYNKGFRYYSTYSVAGVMDTHWIPNYGAVLSAINTTSIHGSYITSSISLSSVNITGFTMSDINYSISITPRNTLTGVNYYIGTQSTTSFILNFLIPLTGTIIFDWNITT